MIKEAIVKIVNKEDLTYDEAYTVMNEIMGGETTPTQNAAFLAALSTKSAKAETTDEIAGCAAADERACGTGENRYGCVRNRRNRRRQCTEFQHFNNLSTCCGSRRHEGGKARKQGSLFIMRHSRLS